ncbi:MAG: PAS domain S-box protein [Methanoregula sp.]|nr:PAS domain S-box protein [Methanoregula sp.]
MSGTKKKTKIPGDMFSVLYVDDEPVLLDLAKIFLESTGDFRVDTVTSAPEALDIMSRSSYDCIISDYQMPGMDGIVFLKTVRSKGNVIPFIIFTGKGREEVVIEALNSGADFYLQKGGDAKAQFVELAHKIRQAIQIKIAQKTMQDLVQGAPIPEFVIDSSHHVIFWNRALEEYSGIAASDIVGTTDHWKAFYPSRRPCLADLIVDGNINGIARWYAGKQAQSSVTPDSFEATDYFPAIKGGTWLFFTAAPLRDPSGNITGAVETLQDITSIRKKEDELRQAYVQMQVAFEHAKTSQAALNIQNKMLEASEQRYRNVVEDQTEFISRFLPDGTHVFVNEAYCRYFNKTRDEIIGKKFIPSIPADDQSLVREHFASLTKDHPTAIVTHRIILADGEIRWQRWSDRAIFDEDGTLTEYQSVGRDVTEQKRAELALIQSERQLADIINFLPDATLVIDHQGRVIAWNRAIEDMTGIPAADMVGKGDYEYAIPFYGVRRPVLIDMIFDSEDTIARQYYGIIHKKGALLIAETDLPRLKGRRAVLWGIASPLYDDKGTIIGAIESIRDVTGRREMEDAIRDRELQLNSFMQSLPIGVFRNTPGMEGVNIMANPVVATMHGFDTLEEFRKYQVAELYADPQERQKISDRLIREGRLSNVEIHLKKKNGELFWARLSAVAIPGPGGTIAYFDGVLEDVTDHKRAEEALRESEASLAGIFRAAPVGIGLVSDRILGRVNDRICEMTGYSRDELVGRNSRILYPTDEDYDYVGTVKYAMIRERGTGTVETRWMRKDGMIRDILLSSTPLDPSDIGAGVMFTALDITDRKNAENELRAACQQLTRTEEELREKYEELAHAKETLKEANRKLHLLSSITRHDILNKVSVLLGHLAQAKTRSSDPTMARYIEKLESAAMAIKEQIEFTRVYQDLGSHEPHWHNLDQVISRLQVPPLIVMHLELPHVEIFADPIFKKVFYNFLDNAVRHGQKVSTITVSAREVPDGLVITWEDDGVGIPAHEKEKIFSKDYGKHTGLGLFLAAEICSVTGITLKETGEPGTGARFEMLVPTGSYRFSGHRKKILPHKDG